MKIIVSIHVSFSNKTKSFYDDEIALQHSLGNIEVHTRATHYDFNPANWRVTIRAISFKHIKKVFWLIILNRHV